MKDQILKIAKVKSEKEFYKKYPTEEAFMAKHGKALKKAAMGTKMVDTQLTQLTDWSNPPQAQDGGIFNVANAISGAFTTPGTPGTATTPGTKASGGLGDTLQNLFGGDASAFGKANPNGAFGKGGVGTGAGNFGKGMAAGAGAAGIGLLNAAPQILQGIGQIGEQKKAIKKANQMSQISGLTAQAAESRDISKPKNQYVRPEDQMIQGLNPQGSGTNFLAAYGASIGGNPTEIQNTYNPGDLYSDLGYEPLNDSNVKQFQKGGKVKFDPSTYKSRPTAESSDIKSSSKLLLSAGTGADANDFSNYSTTINKYANMGNDTSYMSTRNTPTGTEEFFHNTNQGNPISQLRRGKEFIDLSPDQVNAYKQKVLTGTGGFEHGGHLHKAEFGEYFQNSGQASIGKGAGSAIGSAFFGPVGGMVGGFLGGIAGNALGGAKDARQLKGFEDTTKANTERSAIQQGIQGLQSTYSSSMEDGGWVSNEWQPQTITTFGEHKVKDLLKPPYDADMLRSGGHLAQVYYTPPSAAAMYTDRAQNGTVLDSNIRSREELQSITDNDRYNENLRSATSSIDTYADGRPIEKTDLYSMTKGRNDNQRVKEFLRSQTGNDAPQYSMQKTYKPLFSDQYKTVSREIGAGRGERRMADMEQFLSKGNMEYGGSMAMGGDLEVHRGKAEPISYNPFLQDGGETVMFKGPSHDNGGMPISYGNNGVEVEGGEPAVKLADGGSPDGNLVVFGNMKIDDMAANHIGVEASKGKKYKSFIKDLSKFESKQNKVVSKGTKLVDASDTNDPFDQLAMNSGRAMMMGGNAKLLNAAIIKERAAGVQNAILDTAKEYGVKSDELAQGKFVKDKNSDMAKYGAKMETAQDGTSLKGFLKTPLAERKKLAKELGYTDYSGKDVKQQEKLYDLFKSKKTSAPSRMSNYNESLPIGENIVANALGSNYNPYATTVPYQQGYSNSTLPDVTVSGSRKKGYKPTSANITGVDIFGNYTGPQEPFTDKPGGNASKSKFDWKGLAEGVTSNLGSLFRPSNQEELDPSQLMPEYFSLASNQLEPVNAQQYNPRLKEAYNISLQDQLNEVDSQVRAATKMIGSNPSAAAQIFAQAADAKNKIRGEQFRMNQANEIGTQNANIDTLNQAQLQNLQLLDQQYVRQAQAKSNTKAQTLEALKSIAAKTAQNKLDNRQLGIMENMYNFRFGPNGQAYNTNNPYQFNPQGSPFAKTKGGMEFADDVTPLYDASGKIAKLEKKSARNGSIVKALKSL